MSGAISGTPRVRPGSVGPVDAADARRRPPLGDNPLLGHRGATTRNRILHSALDVFAQHGYHDTRVEPITGAAGCSRPTFYQYFSSKDGVFWHLAGRLAREMDNLAEGLDGIAPDRQGLEPLQAWVGGRGVAPRPCAVLGTASVRRSTSSPAFGVPERRRLPTRSDSSVMLGDLTVLSCTASVR